MKRYILIAKLMMEPTGRKRFTIEVTLRGGETYRMPSRDRELYDRLNAGAGYDFRLQVAMKVLRYNDLYFDEVEFI